MNKLVICALSLALAAPLAAQAATGDQEVVQVKVAYGDLNLTNAADAKVMLRRLDAAQMTACGASHFSLREVQKATRDSACYREGLDQAVASLNSPTVNALHRGAGDQFASR